ncbi:unnamed protein product [Ectocarpus sp. 4 AP-2014]
MRKLCSLTSPSTTLYLSSPLGNKYSKTFSSRVSLCTRPTGVQKGPNAYSKAQIKVLQKGVFRRSSFIDVASEGLKCKRALKLNSPRELENRHVRVSKLWLRLGSTRKAILASVLPQQHQRTKPKALQFRGCGRAHDVMQGEQREFPPSKTCRTNSDPQQLGAVAHAHHVCSDNSLAGHARNSIQRRMIPHQNNKRPRATVKVKKTREGPDDP